MNEQEVMNVVNAVLMRLEGERGGEGSVDDGQQDRHSPCGHTQCGHTGCACKSKKMTLELANALIEKVKQQACAMGIRVVAAVSDPAARPVAVQCMDGAYIASFDIALNKTFTAAALQMSTAELAKLSAPDGPLYGIQHTNQGKIVILGGGEPLMIQGTIVGALGVSGGTAPQDTELAAYGREIFEEVSRACK